MSLARATLAALLATALAGCASQPTRPDRLVLAKGYDEEIDLWRQEAARQFGGQPFVIACHGSTAGGRWVLVPTGKPGLPEWLDAEAVAWTVHLLYPDRRIVLLACNPEGKPLGTPGAVYARTRVWWTPDSADRSRVPTTQCTGTLKDFTVNP